MWECVFCNLIDSHSYIPNKSVHETRDSSIYRIEPLNPVVPGHMLFVSWGHFELPHDSLETGIVYVEAINYAKEQGVDYNIIINAGADAGQTVKHMHIHYVPRAKDDGLKLPWTEQQERMKDE